MSSEDKPKLVAGELPPLPEPASKWFGFPATGTDYFTKPQMIKAVRDVQFSQPVQQPAAVPTASKPTHEQAMAGYAVACRYGVLENRAFNLTDDMFAAFAVPAAGVQGDAAKANFWFDCLYKCAKLLELDEQTPIPSGVVAAVEKLVAQQQPDSGRDSALEEAAQICDDEAACSVASGEQYGRDAAMICAAGIRALAAHPAPSSDAALYSGEVVELAAALEQEWLAKSIAEMRAIKFHDGAFNAGYEAALDEIETRCNITVAHPANGAQAGDTERLDILIRYCGSDRFCLIDQKWHFLDPRGRVAGIGVSQREAIDAAIVAATKKGG